MSRLGGTNSFVIADDHDIQSIDYSQTPDVWFQQFLDGAYQGTITGGLAGAKASFKFAGTALGVVGVATTSNTSGPPAARFSIDGQVVQTTTAPNNGSDNYSFDYLDLDGLDSKSHVLEIDVLNATRDYPFYMDCILYLPVQGVSPTASQVVITTFLPAPTSSSSQQASTGKSSVPVGPIVGGVVGGLAVIVAACIAIWFLCFRRRRSTGQAYFYAAHAKPGDLLDEEEVKATPYAVPPSVAPSSTFGPGSQYQPAPQSASQAPPSAYSASAPSHYTAPSGLGYGTSSAYTPSEAPVSDYSSGSGAASTLVLASGSTSRVRASPNQPGRSKAAEAGMLSVPQEATFHADSGVRFDENGQPIPAASSSSAAAIPPVVELSDVPPSYTPA
ncbi:hypothetical protein OH76DRAFT_1399045 [Lentinus brumalis]|uniref:Uncharacterized protein n=1 Tax=Lentinus brumalis TaxID=2498619 RepID=A0A371DMZ9_9APHY|nr:hypothetical protein OH76DRAFT_1399045 [Polyporus brumalis]